mgnify:CR=1 FL=1
MRRARGLSHDDARQDQIVDGGREHESAGESVSQADALLHVEAADEQRCRSQAAGDTGKNAGEEAVEEEAVLHVDNITKQPADGI